MDKVTWNPRSLFLIDGCGALLSAFFLGVVLTNFETTFGMPRKELYILSLLACTFAIYSFFCYFRIKENWKPFLRAIAIINLTYCCITAAVVFHYNQELTKLGMTYFVLEIAIVVSLSILELKTASK